MLRINNMVPPSAEQWMAVIRGMRLPMKSADKSDSVTTPEKKSFIMGESDYLLALRLTKAGSSDRKFLRQLPVIVEINAPLYWWKQMDKYSVGTETNSESTMHTLTKKEFEIEDFSLDNLQKIEGIVDSAEGSISDIMFDNLEEIDGKEYFEYKILNLMNDFRDEYLETHDKKYWYAIIDLLPESYNQTRCWSANYEVLLNIIQQREGHKLGEWKTFIDYCLENVPYLKEFYEAAKSKQNEIKDLKKKVEKLEKDNEWLECKWDDDRLSSMEDKLGV